MHTKTIDVQHFRAKLDATGHTQADLSRTTGVHYVRLNGAINGLWGLTAPQAARVDSVLDGWLAQQQAAPGRGAQ